MSEPGRQISARITLLDAQIIDADRLPVGRVDDLELTLPTGGGPPQVEAVLTGAQALGRRLGGLTGELMEATAARLRRSATEGPTRLHPDVIEQLEPMVKLRVRLSDLPHVAALERYLGQRVERIPGAGSAAE